ncbi:Uncharacterized conserved protein YecE, DUF72 family [Desulfacinum hydrothermale DSM 13146]|uniref:Uncharacterized conserved protein YecE, DUF72 family n=1 Tax=Desulfacinum hydrothermale DSM 13146 TaxID=1121390 RepID=A0A1W1XG96_9BACT|nr:DUF72 domain-containing protein [Desulfacinum hydrothermale]SMC23026.1 Uncharacterized conserved protein YecE, DUF72 family [Desulfacinum hydrothermale DSM 13146]
MSQRVRIGTSGWIYRHWQGPFYPEGLSQRRWLEHYARHFDTVELNATFYRLPAEKTFLGWKHKTPDGFLWSVKAPRTITHYRKLQDVEEQLAEFLNRCALLESKLGPILFQLPPSLRYDEERFGHFADLLESVRHPVVEVRHRSWLNDRFFDQLDSHRIALCLSDTAGRYPYAEILTAPFIYIRLHGSQKLYASSYSEEELQRWAEKILSWQRPTYVYFDNDFQAHAVANAKRLQEILGAAAGNGPFD